LEKLFCGIPGLVVIAPSVYHDVGRVLRNALNLRMPVLFIEDKRMYMENIIETPEAFGGVCVESENEQKKIEIITYGYCVRLAVESAEILAKDGITSEIITPLLISHPEAPEKEHFRVTIEEGTSRMAWGSQFNPDLMITAEDSVIPAYGESEVLPSVEKIVKAVREHVCNNAVKV
jgi:deoxyxylulose-5-phosphate synthase